jgi:outer membrane biosynthesis protein TonB
MPRHTQLLNDAMDSYLFPHLFHGAEEDLAARGLWAAAQLSAAQKDLPQASDWSTDLTNLYAGTPEAAAAKTWLAKQPAPALNTSRKPQATNASDDTGGESEAETEESAEPEAQPDEPKAKSKSTAKPKPKPKSKTSKKPAAKTKEEDADE